MFAKTIDPEAAKALDLQPLTVGYRPEETPMLENVMHDMRRSGRPWALVPDPQGFPEVWVRHMPAPRLA